MLPWSCLVCCCPVTRYITRPFKMATTYVPLLTNHFGQFNTTKAADMYPDTDFDGLNIVERLWGEFSCALLRLASC